MKNGVIFGRYLPLHRGHMFHILQAATLVDTLHIFIIEDEQRDRNVCRENGIAYIDGKLRLRWLCEQLQDMTHIKIHLLVMPAIDLTMIEQAVNEQMTVDVMFVKKQQDLSRYQSIFASAQHVVLPSRFKRFPMVSNDILSKPLTHWSYLVGSARSHFVKKILITGTESCGKTTLIKALGKLYHTSWCEEVGRHYAQLYMGGNEEVFTDDDFARICWLHKEKEFETYRSANRIAFVDTDAVVTQYYAKLYLNHEIKIIESLIELEQYDLILLLRPDVQWVADGQRLNSDQQRRWKLHETLKQMYESRGFKVVEIGGNYHQRLNHAIDLVDELVRSY